MTQLKVGVLSQIPNLLKELSVVLPNVLFRKCETGSDACRTKSDILVADFDLLGPILYDLKDVKWVQGTWAGADALLPHVRPENPPPYPVVRFSGKHFGRLISEYVVACIVGHERDLVRMHENRARRSWTRDGKIEDYRAIHDLSVGVLGIGNIGTKLGEIIAAFGGRVLMYGRRAHVDLEGRPYRFEYFNKLDEFLGRCDYVVNTLPNTPETRGLLNGNVLERCKEKRAVLINVGRGSIIDDKGLIASLENGWLSAAYLDVFNEEPLPSSSKLWKMPQIKISPHVAAVSRAKDIAEQFRDNLQLYRDNKPFTTLLDFKKGY